MYLDLQIKKVFTPRLLMHDFAKTIFGSNVIISHIQVPGYNMQKSEH